MAAAAEHDPCEHPDIGTRAVADVGDDPVAPAPPTKDPLDLLVEGVLDDGGRVRSGHVAKPTSRLHRERAPRSSQHGERVRGRADRPWCHLCAIPVHSITGTGRVVRWRACAGDPRHAATSLRRTRRRHRDDPHGRLLALPVRARSSRGRGLARHRARQGGPLWTRPRREYAGAGDSVRHQGVRGHGRAASRGDGQGRHDRRTGHRGDRDAPDDLGRPRDGRGLEPTTPR